MPRRQREAKNNPPAGATSAPRFGSGKKAKQGKRVKQPKRRSEQHPKQAKKVETAAAQPEGGFAAALRQLTGDFASRPERFFTSSAEDSGRLLAITKEMYLFVKTQEAALGREFSALPELYTDGLRDKLSADDSGASTLVSLLYSDNGPLNVVIELWRHESMQRAQESRVASRQAEKWKSAIGEIANLSTDFRTEYMRPLPESPWQ